MPRLDYTTDDQADDRLNPMSELSKAENNAPNQIEPGDSSSVNDLEKEAGDKSTNDINYQPSQGNKKQTKGRFSLKKSGPIGLITGLLVGGGMFLGTLGTGLAGIAFVENVVGDINDKLAALTEGNERIFRNRFKSGPVKGCGKLSIRCKVKTMSNAEVARYERAGFKVSGSKNAIGRFKPESIEFRGQKFNSPESIRGAMRTNAEFRNATLRASNMKYRGLMSNGPFGKVMKRFGISKRPPGTKGSKKDRMNQLMTAVGAQDNSKIKLVDVIDDNDNPIKNEDGSTRQVATVEDIDSIRQADAAEKGLPVYENQSDIDKAKKTIEARRASPSLSKTKRAAIGAASALGYADIACSVRNLIIGASVAAKIVNETKLIEYAMPLLSSVGRIKAGEATPEDAELLGDLLTQTDTRRQIESIDKSSVNAPSDVVMVDNPNYGRSAMDSALLSMSTNGGVASPTESTSKYAVGMSPKTLGAMLANTALSIAMMGPAQEWADVGCQVIQHPLTRVGGIVLAIFGAIGSGGSITAMQAVTMGAMIAGMATLEYMVNSALTGDIVADLRSDDMVGRGEALWTGTAALEGATARQTGLMPGNVEDIKQYALLRNDVDQQYANLEREDAKNNPFDISNQYSLLGSISRSVFGNFGYSSKPINILSGIAKTSMAIINPLRPAYAKQFDAERFSMCDDSEYERIGINADVQCNVRYVMPQEDLDLDVDEVIDYMEQQGCGGSGCVEEDSETGLPAGYNPPEQDQGQKSLINMAVGAASEATIGQFFDSRNIPNNEYAHFLEACVYRVAPFGKTGDEYRIGGLSPEWDDGSNCTKKGKPYSYYRMYTLYKNIVDVTDENEDSQPPVQSSDPVQPGAESLGDIAWPVRQNLYQTRKTIFLKGHGVNSGTFVSPGGRTGKAVDLGANSLGVPVGEPIYAMLGGKVTRVAGGHAPIIRSTVPGGTVEIAYAHGKVLVKSGDTVQTGQHISGIDNLGKSFGAHLHLDMNYNGKQFCPQDLFIFMDSNPGKLPNFSDLVSKASGGGCSRL